MTQPGCETYQLDLGRYELRRRDGVKVKLERQPMELLIFLVEKTGLLVTREEVAAKLWPGGISVETEPSINNAIRKIRTALRDSPDKPRHLETVVGKGYRFIGQIEIVGVEASSPRVAPESATAAVEPPQAPPPRSRRFTRATVGVAAALLAMASAILVLWLSPARAGPVRSLAVLPLQNLSGDASHAYFADGLTEELTTNLARIRSLRVISRTSTLRYADRRTPMPQIARELGVDAVLEGSIVLTQRRIRVTAQLIDAHRDAHLWAQSYERDLGDILELQDSLALDIASQIKASLDSEPGAALGTHHAIRPEAFEAYLHGRSEIARQTPQSIRGSLEYFQHAIDLDPLYAAGYAGLADSFSLMANYSLLLPKEAFPRAKAAARRALELDSSLPEAHASLAFAIHHFDWDWAGAEAEYKRAEQIAPSYATARLRYADFLSNAGRHEEAIREINRARDLDPLSAIIAINVGRVLLWARRYDDAIRELQKVLVLDPSRMYARIFLGMAYEQKGMYPEAIAEFDRTAPISGGVPGVGLAQAHATAGNAEVARRMLRDYVEVPDETGVLDWAFIAAVYATLGETEQAFAWLDKAYENRDFTLTYLGVWPFFGPLRSDPRFAALLKRVGIPR